MKNHKTRRGGSDLSPKYSANIRIKPTNRSRTIKKIFSDMRKSVTRKKKIAPTITEWNTPRLSIRDKTIRKMFKPSVYPEMKIINNPLNI